MGNPAGVAKKKREKRHKKHMLQLERKWSADPATTAGTPPKSQADANAKK